MIITVKVVRTRADLLCAGDVCRPLEWENRRPDYRKIHAVRVAPGDARGVVHVLWEPHSEADFPERFGLYDLFELQVVETPKLASAPVTS